MGASGAIRLGILTSSRADFGIYLPLLKLLKQKQEEFIFELIVFGTHLSKFHGYTKVDIIENGYEVSHEISSLTLADDVNSIATGYALTALKFADFWNQNRKRFDWIICLGDRFEMAAAVSAGIPYGIKFAHIHAGETTLGAIDNIYRHSITLASQLHFVSVKSYQKRVFELVGDDANCYITGALSLDSLDEVNLLEKEVFFSKWAIKFKRPYILVTIHPETVEFEKNDFFAKEIIKALQQILIDKDIIITMPNADTNGSVYRGAFQNLKADNPETVILIENFGTQSYFTCMNYAEFIIGNTSSGIIEAASFNKYVINIGDRQKGRLIGDNVLQVPFDHKEIIAESMKIGQNKYQGRNLYKLGKAAPSILDAIKMNTPK